MRSSPAVDLRAHIRDVPGFPRAGIVFRDITPLLRDATAFAAAVEALAAYAAPLEPDYVIGAEARGLIAGGALARELGAGFLPARKPGRLPARTVAAEYQLEYGVDSLELHEDDLAGARVLVHDDLLATGGTAEALVSLATRLGAEVVGSAFLVELAFLGGRARLAPVEVYSLISYEEE